MTSERYLKIAIGTLLVGGALVAGVSYEQNAYGLFGDVRGRSYVAYSGERTTKYLFSFNYVPANFSGLLVGSSISANWNTKRIVDERIYNASISGANIFEEGLAATEVMNRKSLHWLIIALHPYLTMTHGRRSEYMSPREYWSALGSINLFAFEATSVISQHSATAELHNDYGDWNFTEGLSVAASRQAMQRYVSDRQRTGLPSPNFTIAPHALEDLREVFSRAKNQEARIMIVYPPVYRVRFDAERADWEKYWERVRTLFPAGTSELNFNTAAFDTMRGNIDNFQDSVHLSRACADDVVDEIGRAVRAMDRMGSADSP